MLSDGFEEHTYDAILLVFIMGVFILPFYQLMVSPCALYISRKEKIYILYVKVLCIYLFTDEGVQFSGCFFTASEVILLDFKESLRCADEWGLSSRYPNGKSYVV